MSPAAGHAPYDSEAFPFHAASCCTVHCSSLVQLGNLCLLVSRCDTDLSSDRFALVAHCAAQLPIFIGPTNRVLSIPVEASEAKTSGVVTLEAH